MVFLSVREAASKWDVDPRAVQRYCASGKIPGAKKYGRAWMIPGDTAKPCDSRKKPGKTQQPQLYPGLFLLEDLRLGGRSAGDIAADLPDEEHRREFFAEPAFLQGKTKKGLERLSSIKKPGI